jgi:hypothetical protein
LGYPPNRIDITTVCDGIDFEECYNDKIEIVIEDSLLYFIDLENLRKNKRALDCPQDWADLDNLKEK